MDLARNSRPLGAVAIVALLTSVARADPPSAADALFREGRALLARGDIDGACTRFAESQKLEASGGTLMNLADCREKQGRTASAWAHFRAAEELSKAQGRAARAAEARRRGLALEPMLSRLTIVAPHAVPDLEIRRGEELIEPRRLGAAIAVDPGLHRLVAQAPGYEPAIVEITIGPRADAQTATIPELRPTTVEPTPAPAPFAPPPPATAPAPLVPPPPAPPPADRPPAGTTNHALGWVVGGSGIALAGIGSAFYLLSLSANEEAEKQCQFQAQYGCSDRALDAEGRRDTYATLATIGGVAGLAGIGVGAWLLLTAPSEAPARTTSAPRLIPTLAPHAGSLVVKGAFP